MEESELVLRFLALCQDSDRYTGRIHVFLDEHMERTSEIFENLNETKFDQEKDRIWKLFKKSVDISLQVFGKEAFRACNYKLDKYGKNKFVWGPISKTAYEVQMLGFLDYELREIIEYSDSIREAFINLALNNPNFLPILNPGSKQLFKYRISTWKSELRQIIGLKKDTRSFSYALKKELFSKNKACTKCGQQIHTINDAQIDHHKPYWKGGETIPENARLMHRYCNRSKSGK